MKVSPGGGWMVSGLGGVLEDYQNHTEPIISPTDALHHLQTADALVFVPESDVFMSFVVSSVSLLYALDQIFAELFHRPLQSGGRVLVCLFTWAQTAVQRDRQQTDGEADR